MVARLSPISSTAAPHPTRVDSSFSLAEPDVAWVAERQSAIDSGLEKKRDQRDGRKRELPGDAADHHHRSTPVPTSAEENDRASSLLSGESDRIGGGNLGDDVPFGKHQGYL